MEADIRDSFGLSNGQFTALVALTLIGGLILEIPLAYYADRLPRVFIAVAGAVSVIGAMFGRMVGELGLAGAQDMLAHSASPVLDWLRRNGRTESDNLRATLAYERNLGRWGHHRMAGMAQHRLDAGGPVLGHPAVVGQ